MFFEHDSAEQFGLFLNRESNVYMAVGLSIDVVGLYEEESKYQLPRVVDQSPGCKELDFGVATNQKW